MDVNSLFKKSKNNKQFRRKVDIDEDKYETDTKDQITDIKRFKKQLKQISNLSTKSLFKKIEIEQLYKGTEAEITKSDMNATAEAQFDTEFDKDKMAQLEKKAKNSQKPVAAVKDFEYKGQSAYSSYLKIGDDVTGGIVNSKMKAGPIRAPKNLRVTCRFDYQPDVCKDYKDTGYCGFGDGCVFMHDRSDYKSGWELEQEWEKKKKKERENLFNKDKEQTETNELDDGLPFACLICRNEFVNPVVTKCKHYFCEKCALKNFSKTQKCYVCNAPTDGCFSVAKDIIAKIKRIKNK